MKNATIFLFGATGATGRLVLKGLLENGYRVKALARNPVDLADFEHVNLKIVKGDVFKISTYQDELKGIACVISVLGTGTKRKRTTLYSEGGANILKVIKPLQPLKLITISSGGVQEDDPVIQNSFFYRIFGLWYFRHLYSDMKKWEAQLDQNLDVKWVCIRPTYLQNKSKTGHLQPKETEDLTRLIEKFRDTWNQKNAEAFGALFTENAEFTDIMGNVAIGQKAVIQLHRYPFEAVNKDALFTIDHVYFRYLPADLVMMTAYYVTTNSQTPGGQTLPPFKGVLQLVAQKIDEGWQISLAHNTAVGQDFWGPATATLKFV